MNIDLKPFFIILIIIFFVVYMVLVTQRYNRKNNATKQLVETSKNAATWMKWWLDQRECDCDGTHTCGFTERQKELKELREALKAFD